MNDEHHYLIMQIKALLDKHLGVFSAIESLRLWRVKALIEDEIEEKKKQTGIK